ncbi:MAG: hypothetical protein WCJ59_00275 [bacterium]
MKIYDIGLDQPVVNNGPEKSINPESIQQPVKAIDLPVVPIAFQVDIEQNKISANKRLMELKQELGILPKQPDKARGGSSGSVNETENLNDKQTTANNLLSREYSKIETKIFEVFGKEKKDRYLYLINNKISNAGEYMEQLELQQELNAITYKVMHEDANHVPEPVQLDSSIKVFTPEDVVMWKTGADKFSDFNNKVFLNDELRRMYLTQIAPDPYAVNEFKALFLKEKAAFSPGIPTKDSEEMMILNIKDEAVIDFLKQYGISVASDYYYDRNRVIEIIKNNPEAFNDFGTNDPDKVMEMVHDNDRGINYVARGLLFGYPTGAVNNFTEEITSKEMKQNRKKAQVYGVTWMDYGDSLESKIKQARLKAAFELSGILKV